MNLDEAKQKARDKENRLGSIHDAVFALLNALDAEASRETLYELRRTVARIMVEDINAKDNVVPIVDALVGEVGRQHDEIRFLAREKSEYDGNWTEAVNENAELSRRLEEKSERADELEEALRFYADKKVWRTIDIEDDLGARARAALSGEEGEEGGA